MHQQAIQWEGKGERIAELTTILKKRFELENPHIEIQEITKLEFDAQYIADEIAMSLERFGSLRFKVIAYRMLATVSLFYQRLLVSLPNLIIKSSQIQNWSFP